MPEPSLVVEAPAMESYVVEPPVMESLVAVGACYIDTILTVEQYPAEDEKLRASRVVRRRGGNCANTLEVLQQLVTVDNAPLSLALISVLPSTASSATQVIKKSLYPVDVKTCICREDTEEPASSYIIKSLLTSSRTIVNYNRLAEMTSAEFRQRAEIIGDEATWYHFEGRIPEVTTECIRHLRERFPNVKISLEVEKPGREGLLELANEVDIIFISKSWATSRGYKDAEDCLRNMSVLVSAALIFCTWGDKGAAVVERQTKGTGHVIKVAASRPEGSQVVDTVGAGDTFIAGMLYGLTVRKDWCLGAKLTFASHLAGYKVVQEGFAGLGSVLTQQEWR